MSLVDFIENLQRKPYLARFRIFLVAILISAVLVMTGFGFSVKYSLLNFAPVDVGADKGMDVGSDMLSLRETLKSSIGEIFNFKNYLNKPAVDSGELEGRDSENMGLRLPR